MNKVAEVKLTKDADAKIVGVEEGQTEIQAREAVKNGSRDRWGNLRANVGGRPKKKEGSKVCEMLDSNRRNDILKHRKQELKGPVQLKLVEELCALAEGFGESARGGTDFWKAAKTILVVLSRKRVKSMVQKEDKIRKKGGRHQGRVRRKVGQRLRQDE